MTKDEALQLALETLENFYHYGYYRLDCFRTINIIKEALETKEGLLDRKSYLLGLYDQKSRVELETKDEPVGWIDSKGHMICVKTDESCRPLYTTPQRTWVGLTDREIEQEQWLNGDGSMIDFARAIEAKLKEKNT